MAGNPLWVLSSFFSFPCLWNPKFLEPLAIVHLLSKCCWALSLPKWVNSLDHTSSVVNYVQVLVHKRGDSCGMQAHLHQTVFGKLNIFENSMPAQGLTYAGHWVNICQVNEYVNKCMKGCTDELWVSWLFWKFSGAYDWLSFLLSYQQAWLIQNHSTL